MVRQRGRPILKHLGEVTKSKSGARCGRATAGGGGGATAASALKCGCCSAEFAFKYNHTRAILSQATVCRLGAVQQVG